jgi:hypothetical protein
MHPFGAVQTDLVLCLLKDSVSRVTDGSEDPFTQVWSKSRGTAYQSPRDRIAPQRDSKFLDGGSGVLRK